MNPRKSLYDVKTYYSKGAVLKGSFSGMRYQVERAGDKDHYSLRATIWAEPFSFENTPDEEKEWKEFAFSEEGLSAVYDWLCEKYENERKRFEHARDYPFEDIF